MLLWSTVLLTGSEEKRAEKERGRGESVSCPSFILDSCGPKQMGLELVTSDSGREMMREKEREREDMFPSICFYERFHGTVATLMNK